jgi:CheY-like chemotaxis protein
VGFVTAQAKPVTKRRILVVDDNPDDTMMNALLIRSLGHEVVTAHNAVAAEKLARTFQPEIVFMDLVLPDADGCHLASELISELGSGLKVYILTAYVDDRAERRALEAGCRAYLVKPLDPKDLELILV